MRRIVARATVDGTPIKDQTIARFHYAGSPKMTRPRHVRAVRRGRSLTVRWDAVAGAAHYGVVVDRGGGSQQRYVVSARRRILRVRQYPLTESGHVSVSAQSPLGDWGPARSSRTFKRAKAPASIFLKAKSRRR